MSSTHNTISVEDLFSLQVVGQPRLSPEGNDVLYVRTWQDPDRNKTCSNLWVNALSGGNPDRLTYGNQVDTLPRWSPDGRKIAFVSNRGEDEFQRLWLLNRNGGEAQPAGEFVGEFTGLDWGPDGNRLVVSARTLSEDEQREKRKQHGETPEPRAEFREIDRLHYKEDGRGFLPETRYHLWIYDLRTSEWHQLTDGDFDDLQPAWSPDGRWIAFTANREEEAEYDPENSDIWIVSSDGVTQRKLTGDRGPFMSPTWSPEGSKIACVGHKGERGTAAINNHHVWILTPDGDERNITPDMDRSAINMTLSDMNAYSESESALFWTTGEQGEKAVVFPQSDRGRVLVNRVPASGGPMTTLIEDQHEVVAFHGRPDCDRFVLLRSTPAQPADLFSADVDGTFEREPLSGANINFREEKQPQKPERIEVEGPGGQPLDCWLMLPPEAPPEDGYPLILQIHGGPHAQYGWTFFHEFQVLASQGYAVAYSNPRGSKGYGKEFAESIRANWGGPVFEDLMAITDELVCRDDVNDDRLGVAGGSYGGYMTNWVIGHTDRFRAAVTMRCVSSKHTLFGTSDFGYEFQWGIGGPPWEHPEWYRDESPLTYVDRMNTPLLIIHSEEDHRCPVSEAEQLYTSLKWQKKDVKMVRFIDESHGLSREGTPLNREERLNQILDWFDRYLRAD